MPRWASPAVLEHRTAPIGRDVDGVPVRAVVEVGYAYDDQPTPTNYVWDLATWQGDGVGDGVWGPAINWTDLTCDVQGMSIRRGATSPAGRYQSSTGVVTAVDPTGRLAPWAIVGGRRPNRAGLPIRLALQRGDDPPAVLFTGWVDRWGDLDEPDVTQVELVASDGFKYLARSDTPERSAVGAGELAGVRVHRILDNAQWRWTRHVAPGVVPLQATTLAQPALEELWLTVDTEAGRLFVDRHGALVFWDRAASAAGDVAWTFTDRSAPIAGACPGRLVTASDDLDVANVIGIARQGGTAVWREDPSSIERHGRRSWSRFDLIHADDAWSATLADLQLGDRAALEFYVSEVVLYPLTDTASWDAALGVELGDLCHVLRRRGGQLLDTLARVVSIGYQVTPTALEVTVGLGPPARLGLAQWDEPADADTGWNLSRWSAT